MTSLRLKLMLIPDKTKKIFKIIILSVLSVALIASAVFLTVKYFPVKDDLEYLLTLEDERHPKYINPEIPEKVKNIRINVVADESSSSQSDVNAQIYYGFLSGYTWTDAPCENYKLAGIFGNEGNFGYQAAGKSHILEMGDKIVIALTPVQTKGSLTASDTLNSTVLKFEDYYSPSSWVQVYPQSSTNTQNNGKNFNYFKENNLAKDTDAYSLSVSSYFPKWYFIVINKSELNQDYKLTVTDKTTSNGIREFKLSFDTITTLLEDAEDYSHTDISYKDDNDSNSHGGFFITTSDGLKKDINATRPDISLTKPDIPENVTDVRVTVVERDFDLTPYKFEDYISCAQIYYGFCVDSVWEDFPCENYDLAGFFDRNNGKYGYDAAGGCHVVEIGNKILIAVTPVLDDGYAVVYDSLESDVIEMENYFTYAYTDYETKEDVVLTFKPDKGYAYLKERALALNTPKYSYKLYTNFPRWYYIVVDKANLTEDYFVKYTLLNKNRSPSTSNPYTLTYNDIQNALASAKQ